MEEKLLKVLEENTTKIEEMQKDINKIKRYIIFAQVIRIIKIILIITPIILAFIYLPPYLKEFWSQYRDLLELEQIRAILGSGI